MEFKDVYNNKMLTTLGIICVLLSVNVQSCEATSFGDVFTKVCDFIGDIIDAVFKILCDIVNAILSALGFTNKDSDTPIIVKNGCERKNSTYFICCVEYKALICFEGQYLAKDIGVEVALIINHKIYWQETISETNPPEICAIDYPDIGEICFKFYDVQIREQHFCLNMSIKLDIIHRIPLKKIHVGCYDGRKDLPHPLNCTINNTTENSFDINCQEGEKQQADKSFWLEVIDSNDLLVENETALTPKFVVSELHPGSVYYAHVFAKNKFGYSLPTVFNITTKEKPLESKLTNAVVNINVMYALLAMSVLVLLGLAVVIVLKRSYSLQRSSKTFQQMKDDLAAKLLPK